MTYAREVHTASVLHNGLVLVAGGEIDKQTLDSTELYDPSMGNWTKTGNMIHGRVFHAASVLKDGKVLVVGGLGSDGTVLNTAEIYDPSTGKWTLTGNLSAARYDHTASILDDGSVLVIGGEDNKKATPTSPGYIVELYNSSTGKWTIQESLNNPRIWQSTCVLKNGKILAIGGFPMFGLEDLSSTELYDPSTGHWTITGSLNQARSFTTASLLNDGRVLAVGGALFEGDPLNNAELYDPSTGNWTVVEDLNSARLDHTSSVLPNGQVLVTGGYGPFLQALVELYDPSTELSTTLIGMKHKGRSQPISKITNSKMSHARRQNRSKLHW